MSHATRHTGWARGALALGAIVVVAAGCGSGGNPNGSRNQTAHVVNRPTTVPAACRGLTRVQTAHADSIPLPKGPYAFPTTEDFATWSQGAPFLVATLD